MQNKTSTPFSSTSRDRQAKGLHKGSPPAPQLFKQGYFVQTMRPLLPQVFAITSLKQLPLLSA